ncbi:MAG: glutamine--fructose-6-phosphate transaminase (isomerizing) [Myxococcota bacterium]|jgi:glucosamine--fructose-6-phosphate aminotransferase (isomerizing)|nr:glutamine--fructose-6-phosphate transaminase (isomerizing) [Myxococcota bacterium]
MCGIIGYVGREDCSQVLIDALRRLEYRGYDSAGVAIWSGQGLELRRAQGKLSNLERALLAQPAEGHLGIGHTRWATHGRPSEVNAHPHRFGPIALVHNGIIENYLSLREELSARGHVFESQTDTEIAAHLIGEAVSAGSSLLEAVHGALDRIRGSYALVVLSAHEPDRLVAARNQSPLVLAVGRGAAYAASDIPALLPYSRDVIFLEDGETALLDAEGVQLYDAERQPIHRALRRVLWDPISAEKQGFKHFMLKEIHEQPARLIDTLRGRVELEAAEVGLEGAEPPDALVSGLEKVFLVACGTSYHAALVGKFLIEQLARVPTEVDLASEFRYRQPLVNEKQIFVPISQSGETADTLAALSLAKEGGAHVLSICNVVDSSIARASHGTLYTRADLEIGVASTKAFSTQLASLLLLAVWLGRRRGTLDAERARELLEGLRHVPAQLETIFERSAEIRELAARHMHAKSFLFLGRGVHYPIALEGALKLKEISYIHAEGYPAGEMKHGPIALIDEELPVVIIALRNPTYEKVISNLEEVRARGAKVIAVVEEGDVELAKRCDAVIEVPHAGEHLQPLLSVVPLQLLAYHVADLKGTDVDQPRNLAKSVTVE